MRTSELLEKLFDLERSIGVETNATILRKIIDIEEEVLFMQRERAEVETRLVYGSIERYQKN